MRALQLSGFNSALELADISEPVAGENEVIVDLQAAAFNRRDYWIKQGLYPGIRFPVVPGSDGAGIFNGRYVVIDAGIGWGNDQRIQQKGFHLLGMPSQGTFAEKIAVPASNVYDKPEHLSWEEAAALPVAGVTAYRALFTRGDSKPGEKLLITGGGGGVALTAIQFARAIGMDVYVTTGTDHKLEQLKRYGANGGVVYRRNEWDKQLLEMADVFDIILDSAGGSDFSKLIKLCRPGGRIVVYGGSQGKIDGLSPQYLFWRQIDIRGTSMGSPQDFASMLAFVSKHEIRPPVDRVLPMKNGDDGMSLLATDQQIGKIVVNLTA